MKAPESVKPVTVWKYPSELSNGENLVDLLISEKA
jgi:hypothetical protein